MASLAQITRRGLVVGAAGAAALGITGLGTSPATGQQTAHLAPAAAEITASVRCPLDMTVRIETPQYVAFLDVVQDRRPVPSDAVFRTPTLVSAGISVRRKGAGLLASQSTNPDLRLPIQIS